METVLEHQRRLHEERDRLIEAMVKESIRPRETAREQVLSEHIKKVLLDRYMEATRNLIALYRDDDGLRAEELQTIGGPNQFSEFYIRIKQLKETAKRNSSSCDIAVPLSVEVDQFAESLVNIVQDPLAANSLVRFTDEECWGRCFDLHQIYTSFTQLRTDSAKMEYLEFVDKFDRLYDLFGRQTKLALYPQYKQFLCDLIEYLKSFLGRLHPLKNVSRLLKETDKRFESEWDSGIFLGWTKADSALANSGGAALADLDTFSSVEELASLGLDRLKSALMALGLKCGGTLDERAKRLFAFRESKNRGRIESSCLTTKRKALDEQSKEIARLEAHVYALTEQLPNHKSATIENVQRKQARAGLMDDDDDEDLDRVRNVNLETDDDDDDDEDGLNEGALYNPKDLPLGWDGKPIPYWLYKLHGLNLYYNCEICGNFRYRGPKAYQRHFTEWRHAHGMRCFGIPNTPHFANITKIDDALSLWEILRRKKDTEHWRPDVDEEFEDSAGNVVSRKVFEDLRRQGLL